jgi:hypothetical protein
MNQAPEYAFLTPAQIFQAGDRVFSPSAAARARTLAPAFALSALGYEARVYSLAPGADAPQAALRHAKAVVFGDAGGQIELYRPLLALAGERAVLDGLDERTLGIPDACDGPAGVPSAARARRHSKLLRWLGERAGLASEAFRIHLLWSGEDGAVVGVNPQLEELGRRVPLILRCLCPQGPALESLADRLVEKDPEALRIALAAWTPQAMAHALASCDLVLLPSPIELLGAIRAGRFAIARPSPHYGPLSEFAWTGEDVAQGIEWALAHPEEVLARLARAQEYVNRVHAPEAVARAWLQLFRGLKK